MTSALSPAGWTLAVAGVFLLLFVLVLLRLLTRDRGIHRARSGVFYERERDDDWDEYQARDERLARKEELEP